MISSCNKKDTAANPIKANLKVIDKENVPDITPDIYTKWGFANFVPDLSRNVILDFSKSELIIPYNKAKTKFNKSASNMADAGICLKIATRKSSCKSGIGFRCGFFTCGQQKESPVDSNTLSRNRIQPVKIMTNKVSGELILKFINKIDWKYLNNN